MNEPGVTSDDKESTDEKVIRIRYTLTVDCLETADGKRSCSIKDIGVNRGEASSTHVDQPSKTPTEVTNSLSPKEESALVPLKAESDCEICDLMENVAREFTKPPDTTQTASRTANMDDARRNTGVPDRKQDVPRRQEGSRRPLRSRDKERNEGT